MKKIDRVKMYIPFLTDKIVDEVTFNYAIKRLIIIAKHFDFDLPPKNAARLIDDYISKYED